MIFPPQFKEEKEFLEIIKKFGPQMGYGRMMQMVSDYWRDLDPVGALSIGPCFNENKRTRDERNRESQMGALFD